MKNCKPTLGWVVAFTASLVWLTTGCRTANVNPPSARSNTGYVDFYTDPAAQAYWYLARQDERSKEFKEVYSEFNPPRGGILRVAMRPGRHTFRVAFLNKVFENTWTGDVEVLDGMITPVQIDLVPVGEAIVQSYKGVTRGRIAGTDRGVQPTYRIDGEVRTPVPYQLKEEMNYPIGK